VEGVYNSGEGAIVTEGLRGSWLEFLSQRGWHIGTYDSFDEFWDLLLERGGWWNPIRKKKEFSEIFNTPTGKFEFYSQVLKNRIDGTANKKGINNSPQDIEFILGRLNITTRGDAIFLPHHEPIPYDDGMPIYLTTFQPITNRDGHASNLPLMQEMFGFLTRNYWNSWVELNPETASTYGISDDDWVWIESVNGSIKVKAKVHPGVMPSVAVVPFGLGHTSSGRYAKNHGVNPNSIMKNLYDTINGMPATQSTKVKISRAK
jgi:anaerobic selenocysteine-containing dehydrogenase